MFQHAHVGKKLKVYVDGGGDFTGIYQGPVQGWVEELLASNGLTIRIRAEAVVAVVEL